MAGWGHCAQVRQNNSYLFDSTGLHQALSSWKTLRADGPLLRVLELAHFREAPPCMTRRRSQHPCLSVIGWDADLHIPVLCLSSNELNCPSPPIHWNKMLVNQTKFRSFPRPLNLAPSGRASRQSLLEQAGLEGNLFYPPPLPGAPTPHPPWPLPARSLPNGRESICLALETLHSSHQSSALPARR